MNKHRWLPSALLCSAQPYNWSSVIYQTWTSLLFSESYLLQAEALDGLGHLRIVRVEQVWVVSENHILHEELPHCAERQLLQVHLPPFNAQQAHVSTRRNQELSHKVDIRRKMDKTTNQAWGHMPVIPVPRRLKQQDNKLQAICDPFLNK